MDEHRIIFSAHLNCDDLPLSQVERIYSQVEKILYEKYGICHVTIQAEYHRGKDEKLFNTPVDEKRTKIKRKQKVERKLSLLLPIFFTSIKIIFRLHSES